MFQLFTAAPVQAQTPQYGGFIDVSGQYYTFPGKPFGLPAPGIRIGVGITLPIDLHLSLNSGITLSGLSDGDKRDLLAVPIGFQAQYGSQMTDDLLVRIGAIAGIFYMMIDYSTEFSGISFFVGPRVHIEWLFPVSGNSGHRSLSLVFGTGLDLVIEERGTVTLPQIEFGIRWRPYLIQMGTIRLYSY